MTGSDHYSSIVMKTVNRMDSLGPRTCTYPYLIAGREGGHALGALHGKHPEALMTNRVPRRNTICDPTIYDIAALGSVYNAR